MSSPAGRFVVVGQVGRDLVLAVDELDGAPDVRERREMLGGKGANQAVALTQLGGQVALVGAVGDDSVGRMLLADAQRDGIDVCAVAQRGQSALHVDIVGDRGRRRLYEHIPSESRASLDDVRRADHHIRAAGTVCLQLQQPPDALLAAARRARTADARVALDGGMGGAARDELLRMADVVRADAREAGELVGFDVTDEDSARAAAAELLGAGVGVVAIEVPGRGDLVAEPSGAVLLPVGDCPIVDPTGAGDAFFAGLVTALARGEAAPDAGRLASACAGATVARLGGRPDLADVRAH